MKIDKLVKEIAKLTDINSHTEAALTLAQYLESEYQLTDQLNAMYRLRHQQELQGHMTYEQIQQRSEAVNKMIADLPPEHQNIVHAAF